MKVVILTFLFLVGLVGSLIALMYRNDEDIARTDTTGCTEFLPEERVRAWREFEEGYESYKNDFITSEGAGSNNQYLRVKMPESWVEPPNKSTSESIGYGMVFAVHAGDKRTFDLLWGYAKSHFINGLMHWNVAPDNEWIVSDGESAGPASDADIDMAYALIAAEKKWGGYRAEAEALIDNIMQQEIEVGTFVVRLSPIWGGSDLTSPDRFDPNSFELFADFRGDARWGNAATVSASIIGKFLTSHKDAVLLPEWIDANGNPINEPENIQSVHGYDASRYPIRLAKNLDKSCRKEYLELFERENNFYKNTIKNPSDIVDGYSIYGEPEGQYQGVNSFVSGAYIVSIVDKNPDYRREIADYTKQLSAIDKSYFSQSIYLYSRLVLSGRIISPDL